MHATTTVWVVRRSPFATPLLVPMLTLPTTPIPSPDLDLDVDLDLNLARSVVLFYLVFPFTPA